MMRVTSVLLIDNIASHPDAELTFDDSDVGVDSDSAPAGNYDFESKNSNFTATPTYPGSYGNIIDDPTDPQNKVFKIFKQSAESGHSHESYRFLSAKGKGSRYVLTMDVRFSNVSISEPNAAFRQIYQISIGDFNTDGTVYTFMFVYDTNGKIKIGDTNDTAKNTDAPIYDFVFEEDKWYTLKIEINLSENPSDFLATILVDGNVIATSNNYYDRSNAAKIPSTNASAVDIRTTRRALGELYIDNLIAEYAD